MDTLRELLTQADEDSIIVIVEDILRRSSSDYMTTKKAIIEHCLTYPQVYEDYPFHDPNWCVIRHKENRKVFAWIFDKDGHVWVNLKCDPTWREFWRETFVSVLPAYHLNKTHWNSVILDGTVPREDICRMVGESYDLTKAKNEKFKSFE